MRTWCPVNHRRLLAVTARLKCFRINNLPASTQNHPRNGPNGLRSEYVTMCRPTELQSADVPTRKRARYQQCLENVSRYISYLLSYVNKQK